MKRAIILLLAFVLLVGTMTVPVSASEATEEPNIEIADWNYDNSIIVKVKCLESRTFSPEDFPEVDCKAVWIIEKINYSMIYGYQLWYEYELVLFLNNTDIEKAISDVLKNNLVIASCGNAYASDSFKPRASMTLKSEDILYVDKICVPFGGDVGLYIFSLYGQITWINWDGVEFGILTDRISLDDLTSDSFAPYGVLDYKSVYTSYPSSYFKMYRGSLVNNETSGVDCHIEYARTANNLSKLDYIDGVSISCDVYTGTIAGSGSSSNESKVKGAEFPYEVWSIKDDNIAEISLSGGHTDELNRTFNQTATITGKNLGDTQVVVTRIGENYGIDFGLKAVCTIHVFAPADVNEDGEADSLDAAMILKYDAGIIELSDEKLAKCDMNGDGEVDSLDAALLLKYDAGMYNKY